MMEEVAYPQSVRDLPIPKGGDSYGQPSPAGGGGGSYYLLLLKNYPALLP